MSESCTGNSAGFSLPVNAAALLTPVQSCYLLTAVVSTDPYPCLSTLPHTAIARRELLYLRAAHKSGLVLRLQVCKSFLLKQRSLFFTASGRDGVEEV